MTQVDRVKKYLEEHNGQITNLEAQKVGVSRTTLLRMNKNDQIIKLMAGVYIDPLELGDDFSALQYRFSKGIFFRDTALFLYGMIDRTPDTYEMNFPLSYSYKGKLDIPLNMYRQKNELYEIGITKVKSPRGNLIKTYNLERTLCDILRPKTRSDPETVKQAMNNYVLKSDKNMKLLMEYAEIFKVRDQISKYMEVLL